MLVREAKQSSEESDLAQAVGAALETRRMKAGSLHGLVLFWKGFQNGNCGPAALNQVNKVLLFSATGTGRPGEEEESKAPFEEAYFLGRRVFLPWAFILNL